VLELDATNANALFNRGSTHDSMGRYEEAIVSCAGELWVLAPQGVFESDRPDEYLHSCFSGGDRAVCPGATCALPSCVASRWIFTPLVPCPCIALPLSPCSATTRLPWSSTGASQVGPPHRQRAGRRPRRLRQLAVCPLQLERRRAGCRRG
jgi:hypothetical protein